MFLPHLAILVLLAATPVIAVFDNAFTFGVAAFYVAALLLVVGVLIQRGEATHVAAVWRGPAELALLPILWFIIQLLPFSAGYLPGSIWQSAAEALGDGLLPHGTIDPGLTILALCRFILVTAIVLMATALTIERRQAEHMLLLLGALPVVFAIVLVVSKVAGLSWLGPPESSAHAAFVSGAAYGSVLWGAFAVKVIEQQDFRRSWITLGQRLALPVAGALGLMGVCIAALLIESARYAVFASICGLLSVVGLYVIRQIGLGFRIAVVLGLIGAFAALTLVWREAQPIPDAGIAVRYAAHASPQVIAPANRVATEVGPLGSGAGTFSAIYKIYGTSVLNGGASPATFTSQVAVEAGRYALWIGVLLAGALILICTRGVFQRGRDGFYPAAGAGIGVVALITAFCDPSLSNLGTSIFVAGAIGLALGQTAPRRT